VADCARIAGRLAARRSGRQPSRYLGLELGGFVGLEDGMRGSLAAWGPATGREPWESPTQAPYWADVVSTAFDAGTGEKLWQFQTGSGITGLPIVWERNGRQPVTVTSGAATVYGASWQRVEA
jgi:alcohol dehydrogenase (cytochrome c)